MNLRFITREGKKFLQESTRVLGSHYWTWEDIPGQDEPAPQPCEHEWETSKTHWDDSKFNYKCKKCSALKVWHEVNPTSQPKDFWLIAGRYFETKEQAEMWFESEVRKGFYYYIGAYIIHVREVKE